MKHLFTCGAAAFIVCLVIMFAVSNDLAEISGRILRLHIIANSDSQEDQQIKLKVRDAILNQVETLAENAETSADAEKIIRDNNSLLAAHVESVLSDNGFSYKSEISIERKYFPTREYGSLRLPAGNYKALVIRLGAAEGQNWWCICFPPLCTLGSEIILNDNAKTYLRQALSNENFSVISQAPTPKFRIFEIFGKAKEEFIKILGLDCFEKC